MNFHCKQFNYFLPLRKTVYNEIALIYKRNKSIEAARGGERGRDGEGHEEYLHLYKYD